MRLLRGTVLLLTLLLTVTACAADSATDTTASIRVVPAAEGAELLAAEPGRTVIDVRTPAEYAEGHLEGAVLVDYNAPDFAERIAEFDPEGDYLIYCRSGNRSAGARATMGELGFTDVVDVEGGVVAWVEAGLPLVTG